MNFSVEVTGERKLDIALRNVERGVSDLRPAWPDVASAFYEIERRMFETEGASGASGKWEELSPGYEEYRARHFSPFPFVLYREGKLKGSLTRRGAQYNVHEETADSLKIGTTRPGAIHHQRGGRRLPQRRIIDLTGDDRRRLARELRKYFVKIGRETGFTETELTEGVG